MNTTVKIMVDGQEKSVDILTAELEEMVLIAQQYQKLPPGFRARMKRLNNRKKINEVPSYPVSSSGQMALDTAHPVHTWGKSRVQE